MPSKLGGYIAGKEVGMLIPYKTTTAAPINPEDCTWAVCYDLVPEQFDDQKARSRVIAIFAYPTGAEEFIAMCVPESTRNRYYITQIQLVCPTAD